ncbi:hypothetical protein L2E82_47905 [Cichorium intybus]|uniref:Uncharacterized protein n=1 Tax=Cichorium intybus TaxID=13427 RepID=A0ACB8YYA4_CICIN|nr:hypothetical protein L2E82_47905 [Cichorium intybus]
MLCEYVDALYKSLLIQEPFPPFKNPNLKTHLLTPSLSLPPASHPTPATTEAPVHSHLKACTTTSPNLSTNRTYPRWEVLQFSMDENYLCPISNIETSQKKISRMMKVISAPASLSSIDLEVFVSGVKEKSSG